MELLKTGTDVTVGMEKKHRMSKESKRRKRKQKKKRAEQTSLKRRRFRLSSAKMELRMGNFQLEIC